MNTHPDHSRTNAEQLLGKYLLIAGEIDLFITMSKSLFTGNQVSKTWVKKELADKIKWYLTTLDQNIPENAKLINALKTFDTIHRPFRNTLAHSGLTLNVNNDSFEIMNANGLSDSISLQELQLRVTELSQLNQRINECIALAASQQYKSSKTNI